MYLELDPLALALEIPPPLPTTELVKSESEEREVTGRQALFSKKRQENFLLVGF